MTRENYYRAWRILIFSVLSIFMLAGFFALYIYLVSQPIIERTYAYQDRNLIIPTGIENIVEGQRQARIHGCFNSCHGAGAEGRVFSDSLLGISLWAPNLTKIAKEYSVAEFERAVRQGIKPDGTALFFMPAPMYSNMSDLQLSQIIAFLRQLPEQDTKMDERSFGLSYRWRLLQGEERIMPVEVVNTPKLGVLDLSELIQRGKYIAMTSCSQCHGSRLLGRRDWGQPPSLEVVSVYSFDDFRNLLQNGDAIGGRDIGAMRTASKRRFSNFTREEMEYLYLFLTSDVFLDDIE